MAAHLYPDFSILVNEFTEESAKEFREKLFELSRKNPYKPIIIYIDSYGGYVDSLAAMVEAIESVNMSLRKVTQNRGAFPNDESMIKLLYLALRNISKKWTMPIRNWKSALNQFTIIFEDRMPTI